MGGRWVVGCCYGGGVGRGIRGGGRGWGGRWGEWGLVVGAWWVSWCWV